MHRHDMKKQPVMNIITESITLKGCLEMLKEALNEMIIA